MARPKKYPDELIERGIGLAVESERPIARIAHDLRMHPETLRKAGAPGGCAGRAAPSRRDPEVRVGRRGVLRDHAGRVVASGGGLAAGRAHAHHAGSWMRCTTAAPA